MPVADQLYLLYQQSKDLCSSTIIKWEEHFEWLEEVKQQVKLSRGQTIVPKTPVRKRKIKKENDENFMPPPPNDIKLTGIRKSSRTAAKTAQEKTKKTLLEISNLSCKLRRPSSPKKLSLDKNNEEESSVLNKVVATEEASPERDEFQFNKINGEETDIVSRLQSVAKKDEVSQKERKDSKEVKSEPGGRDECENRERSTGMSSGLDTKKRSVENQEEIEPVGRKTRTKRRKLSEEAENLLPTSIKAQQLSTKEGGDESLHLCITSETDDTANDCFSDPAKIESPVSSQHSESVINLPNRITRSKICQMATSSSSEQQINHGKITNTVTGNASDQNKVDPLELSKPAASIIEPSSRITRSKVRQKTTVTLSEQKENNKLTDAEKLKTINKEYHILKGRINSPIPAAKFSGSASAGLQFKLKKNLKAAFEVQEVSLDSIEVNSSPGKAVKHTWPEKKVVNTVVRKGKLPFQTPSPASSCAIKILGGKGLCNTGNCTSTYSQRRGILNSSPQFTGMKVIGTPTEVNRTKNIMCGTSFLTKVQPTRPTREESEDRKQDELRKRREKEEETRKKKDELLRLKTEEQKRKNEERMKRVQGAREARERKAAEERELQEKERRLREERIKEGKKRNLLTAKKNEEMRQQALRKQMEEEQRLKEEQKIKEEQRLKEEQKIKEEYKKFEQKREAERIAREAAERLEQEKLREAERIAREKKEIEHLKLKETERSALPKKLNETYTADPEGQPLLLPQSSNPKESYAMTPIQKPKPRHNVNDYGITDLRSDDSTDEECAPKKAIPLWAKNSQLKKHLFDQEHYPPNCDAIFPPEVLLKMPDLVQIFPKRKRSRFTKRTSSAVWNTPPCGVFASTNRK